MKKFYALFLMMAILLPGQALAYIPNDTYFEELWYLPHVSATTAWETTTGSSSVIVAIVDAGIDLDHPDLIDNIWINTDEVPSNGLDDDKNGYVDDMVGWDFVSGDNDPSPVINGNESTLAISHGSVVAGIIGAAGDNGQGITGVSWHSKLMSLRTLDETGSGDSTNVIAAVNYAVANGAKVINLSFAGDSNDPLLREALSTASNAGVVVVSAMGNNNIDTDIESIYPACFDAELDQNWILGVAATDGNDARLAFSNYGSVCVDLAAPGDRFFGIAYNNPALGFDTLYGNNWSGTSMAAPVVSGAAALLLSYYPDLTPEQVINILKLSVDPLNTDEIMRNKLGAGRLNIARAIEFGQDFSKAGNVAADAQYIKSKTSATVYLITGSGTRRVFTNGSSFFTYEDSFDVVETVDDVTLSNYPLSGLVLPKAGVVLVKIVSSPDVYALTKNLADDYAPLLRKIESEEIAKSMYGEAWADYVVDIEPSFFTKFGLGPSISSPEFVDTSIMKTRSELISH